MRKFKGGFVHNQLILKPLRQAFESLGADVQCEHRVGASRASGYLDLLVVLGHHAIAIEAEMSDRRIVNDLRKSSAIGADELWIIAPRPRVAASIRRRLQELPVDLTAMPVRVLTLGQAMDHIEQLKDFFSLACPSMDNRIERPSASRPATDWS